MLCGCAGGNGEGDRAKSGTVGTGPTCHSDHMTLQCFKALNSVFLSWISPADWRKGLMLASLAVKSMHDTGTRPWEELCVPQGISFSSE